ncbi:MAG: precorrin-3B C(17)-methyltransferase [Candidatus Omnitrophica bacterium]|nr:precorrin-3B C(17)-methyltransferase [Candidatus Omnitrophota bacterium]
MVGIGPGDAGHMSQRARKAIEQSQVLIGYKTYIGLVGNLVRGKEVISSGMTEEIERAKFAIENARGGKRVCLISSGDPGVYGMAGLVLELLEKNDLDKIEIDIIPGIISANACASLLGAPLMHDFAVISLSDLLTDLGLIKRRIESAAKSDFVIVLYNPKSAGRIIPFNKACDILVRYKSPHTPVGIVRNAYRDNQEVIITTLKELISSKKVNMATTIIIGNSKTYLKGGYMITPRGYDLKSDKGL